MRFDDTLETVLAADLSTPIGIQSAWRQLVDLLGRRRAPPTTRAMATLRAIRERVPAPVRAASARALEFADPPAPLVWLFARDDLSIALPVLRSARLTSAEWVQLLPQLAPGARQVLRNRRDLGPVVRRALESFGPVDFVLPDETLGQPSALERSRRALADPRAAALFGTSSAEGGEDTLSFVPLVEVAPVLPEAPDTDETVEQAGAAAVDETRDATSSPQGAGDATAAEAEEPGPFAIAEVVARIDAFWRNREEAGPAPAVAPAAAERFRFETDAQGVIRWVDGVSRSPVIGLNLDLQPVSGGSRADGVAAGALRSRARFSNARLWIEGDSDAAGDWRISAVPVFDAANGRFTGYRGTARRPRVDERAEPVRSRPTTPAADSLRQLVHELRTPTNAIAGFAEMIESEMLGPVSEPYRLRAHEIREHARELLGAIDDLDLAARIDSAALALVPDSVALRPLLSGIVDDLAELASLRGSLISLAPAPAETVAVAGDRRAVERLLARLLATLVSASGEGERIGVRTELDERDVVSIAIDRPRALADYPGDSVLGIDDEREDSTLLGTGFALRLARNLARELGGGLAIGPESLTLRLPAAVNARMEQAHQS